MRRDNLIRKKSKQVLQALYKHGPMTISTMEKVITPTMGKRSLQMIAKRLNECGLVYKRHGSIYNFMGSYHQLCTDALMAEQISRLLNVDFRVTGAFYPRNQELEHSQVCTLWHEYLERKFPETKIIRDFRMQNDPSIHQLIGCSESYADLLPDMILQVPKSNGGVVNVAVEIERTSKKRSRIHEKLFKFTMESSFDGVLYVCKERRIVNAISDVLENRIIQKSPRIRHFANSFMMFCSENMINSENQDVCGLKNSSIKLANWIHFLASTEMHKRTEINIWLLSQGRKLGAKV